MEPQTETLFDSELGDIARREDEARATTGARWFYWIAALSLLTSIISLVGGGWAFFVSLGVTQIIDGIANALAARVGGSVKVIALAFDLFAAGIFALMGYFASKRHAWAFVLGMALYVLDALLLLGLAVLAGDFSFRTLIFLAFHAYVLWKIFDGYKASARLAASGDNSSPSPPPVATPV